MLSVILLSVIMLNVAYKPFTLSVIMLNVAYKPFMLCRYAECRGAAPI